MPHLQPDWDLCLRLDMPCMLTCAMMHSSHGEHGKENKEDLSPSISLRFFDERYMPQRITNPCQERKSIVPPECSLLAQYSSTVDSQ